MPVWTCAENLAPVGIRSQDRPARSESTYRLSYAETTLPVCDAVDTEKSFVQTGDLDDIGMSTLTL